MTQNNRGKKNSKNSKIGAQKTRESVLQITTRKKKEEMEKSREKSCKTTKKKQQKIFGYKVN